MSEHLLREERDGVVVVTLNRPEKYNAFTLDMRDELQSAVDDLATRDDLRMMLIRASGKYFTAGMDLNTPDFDVDAANPNGPAKLRRDYRLRFHDLFDSLEAVEKPVLAAIQGPCLGLGVELASSCDFRVASESATFALPEVNLGVIAGSGGVSRFTRLCGVGWSKWLNVAGEKIDAPTALTAGFVTSVLTDDSFEESVWQLCKRIVSRPAAAQHAAKLAVDLSYDMDRQGGRHLERLVNTPLIMQDRTEILARAFPKKR